MVLQANPGVLDFDLTREKKSIDFYFIMVPLRNRSNKKTKAFKYGTPEPSLVPRPTFREEPNIPRGSIHTTIIMESGPQNHNMNGVFWHLIP